MARKGKLSEAASILARDDSSKREKSEAAKVLAGSRSKRSRSKK